MAPQTQTATFTLVGRDDERSRDRPGNRQLVCDVEGGGRLAILGVEDDRANIDAVADAGFPCVVACVRSEPKEWQRRMRGYTDVVHARDPLRVIPAESAG